MGWLLALVLTSTSFAPNGAVPNAMVATPCGGENVPPSLHWRGAPPATRSFALLVHDTDAPRPGGFYHWVAYGLHLERSGLNDTGNTGYFGPCPPPGTLHHYHFTLYALDAPVTAREPLTAAQLLARMRGHVLAKAELIATFEKQ